MLEPAPVDDCPLLASVSPLSKGRALTLSSYQTYSFQMGKDREDELYPWCTEGRGLSSGRTAGREEWVKYCLRSIFEDLSLSII